MSIQLPLKKVYVQYIMALEWGTVASIIYFSLYSLLLIVLAIYLHKTEKHKKTCTSFLKTLWTRKGIYGQILIHLYDTSTDIGVLIQWRIYANKESEGENIESINMNGLFWTSISFIILYRIISVIIACYSAKTDTQSDDGYCVDAFLGLIDMYVIKAVYGAMKENATELTNKQRMIQLTEAIFESLPQVVLQSVFIIRSQNDPYLSKQNTVYLVILSLLASLSSIASKYIYADKECVVEEAKESNLSKSLPCVNTWYLLRVIWRFSFIAVRFTVFGLVWSVLGGGFLFIFLALSFILWCTLIYTEMDVGYGLTFSYGFISLVATPAHKSYKFAMIHGIEMMVVMCISTIFAFNDSITCKVCADPIQRQATTNSYILFFIIAGWISMIIDFVTYYMMLYFERFNSSTNAMYDLFNKGIQHKVTPYKSPETIQEIEIQQGRRSKNGEIYAIMLLGLFPIVFCVLCTMGFYKSTCYLLAGIAGVISNIYIMFQFRKGQQKKHEADAFLINHMRLFDENALLLNEVSRFSAAKSELKDTHNRIQAAMKRQKANLQKFHQLNVNLE
eukprot:172809_1